MITDEFDERTVANMDVALERACQQLPQKIADHRGRKFVAEKIVECAKKHTQTLGGLTEAGRRAVAELCVSSTAGKGDVDCTSQVKTSETSISHLVNAGGKQPNCP